LQYAGIALAFTFGHLMVFSFPNALLPTPNPTDVWVRREVSAAVEVEWTANTSDFRLHDASRRGESYVGLARAQGGEKSAIAWASQQGFANHLSIGRSVSGAQPPLRAADAAACNRIVLGRASTPR
jgi:hypothetical protein